MTRLTFIILVINLSTLGLLQAGKANSQNFDKIYVKFEKGNSSVSKILHSIENQTELSFTYSKEIGEIDYSIQTNSNFSLATVFSALGKHKNLKFTAKGNLIAVQQLERKLAVQQSGRLSGKIIDSRGNPLPKASIRILGSNKTVQSGIDGTYSIALNSGNYTIQVSYVSHQTKQISDVNIRSGETTKLDIGMIESSSSIKEVTVKTTYKKASVAGLYAAQKNAATITDGISAEQIARTPDNDMGQVLKRVTGLTTVDNRSVIVRGMSDRYNQAQLDGVSLPSTSQNRRDFAFDIIPTEMVSSVVVNKTATPDISSEFSGGQVSINTLDIPDQNFTSFQIGSGGNSQTTGKDFHRLGQRSSLEYFGFFEKSSKYPKNVLPWEWHQDATASFLIPLGDKTDPKVKDLPLSPEHLNIKYGSIDAIEQSKMFNSDALKHYKFKGMPNQNIRFAIGRVYEMSNNLRFGFSASANFRNEQNIVKFNNVRGSEAFNLDKPARWIDSTGFGQNGAGTSNRFNSSSGIVANLGLKGENFKIALKNMYARTYSDNFNEATRLPYRDLSREISKELYQLPEALSLQQHQIVGEYTLPWGIKSDAMFSINKIKQQILDERKIKYGLTAKVGEEYYFQTPTLLTNAAWSNQIVKNDSRMWTSINETDFNWSASLSKEIDFSENFSNLFKVGYQGWSKNRDLWVSRVLPMTRSYDFDISNNSKAAPIIISSYEELFREGNIGNGNYQAVYYPDRIGGNVFDGNMKSHSAYIMADQKLFNFIRLVYGVRMEYYNLNNRQEELLIKKEGKEKAKDPKFDYLRTVGEKDVRWLPSINSTFSLSNTFNIRASYSKTAIRPDFRETSFFAFYDYELDASISGEKVVSTIVDNVDLRLEWYPSAGEIISVTGYYKYLDKPIELVSLDNRDNFFAFANMESATNLGLEMELRKNFSFLGNKEWLDNLFIYANGTLLKSNVKVLSGWYTKNIGVGQDVRTQDRKAAQDRPLLGQSPWLINLGFGYWGEKFGATVSYNQRGYRTSITANLINQVQFELAPRQVDFQLYGRFLKKRMEAKLNVANILNEWTKIYRNDSYFDKEQIDRWKEAGKPNLSRGTPKYNKKDNDVILYQKQEGRRFGLSLTYSF